MEIQLDELTRHSFVSRFVGDKDRVTIKGEAPERTRWPRVVYEPKLRSFDQDDVFVNDQLAQLNRVRNVRFLPGTRRRFVDMRDGFDNLTPSQKEQSLENINIRHATFRCVHVNTDQRAAIDAGRAQPTMILDAGSKLCAIWLLTETIEGDEWRQIQSALAAHFGATFSLDDPYISFPGSDYIMPDGTRKPVSVEFWDDEQIYTANELRASFGIDIGDIGGAKEDCDPIYDVPTDSDNGNSTPDREPRFLPRGCQLNSDGVFWRAGSDDPLIAILASPLWLAGMVQTTDNARDAHLKLEWLSFGNKLETATMPASYLADRKAMTAFLYQHNIAGFSAKQAESVREYLRGSVMRYNAEHATETAYSRFGWTDEGFVIGSEIVNSDGITPANVIRVPSEMKDALTAKGDREKWARVTEGLDEERYWPHRFALQAILGSPLLKLFGVDSAVLSLAGESGAGKTTIAEYGLSAYGKPKALEIAPQSTEKAFQEKWRIANNLPVLCNEAATIDAKRINNIVYAAANGEPRDTLTQRVELRATSRWSLLTVFTSNNHLQGLDDHLLNEAGRRRILD